LQKLKVAHRAHDTIKFLHRETPDFIGPELWPANSRDHNPVDRGVNGKIFQPERFPFPVPSPPLPFVLSLPLPSPSLALSPPLLSPSLRSRPLIAARRSGGVI